MLRESSGARKIKYRVRYRVQWVCAKERFPYDDGSRGGGGPLETVERIGNQKIWSYFDDPASGVRSAGNLAIRAAAGHTVDTYFELAKKVAELQFLNRDHVLLFRGQSADYRTNKGKGNSLLKASVFRLAKGKVPTTKILEGRFRILKEAEAGLVERYRKEGFLGRERLKRQRILRWAILQHYEVCRTPLLDVTASLRIAASFASIDAVNDAYVFVLGVPNLSGAVTASSEANLQIVRLSFKRMPSRGGSAASSGRLSTWRVPGDSRFRAKRELLTL